MVAVLTTSRAALLRAAEHYENQKLAERIAYESMGLFGEIEEAVLRAIEAGQGPIPSFSGTYPKETEEPVALAITEALDDADCMALLIAHLNTEAGRCLRETIARRWAENMADGVREARENRVSDIAMDMFAGVV